MPFDNLSLFRWCSGTKGEVGSLPKTRVAELQDSARSWRRGLEERIETSWDRVGLNGQSLVVSSRVVKTVVCDSSKPHDEILHPTR